MPSGQGQWYPPEWPERILALEAGRLVPVTPRPAATVMLLREGGPGRPPDVHLLRRRASMAFAAGAYVYPGGGVDPRDHDRLVGWAGADREVWARRLGLDDPMEAQAVVCAAVRETYEEADVLLAGESPDTVVGDVSGDDWQADRAALAAHELSFAVFLAKRRLLLRSDLLGAWTRWITPEFEARRYDTWFFVAALPTGQRTRNASTEADHAVWTTPAEALAGYDAGDLTMLPPTVSTLRTLLPYVTVPDALAAAAGRDLAPVLARAHRTEDGRLLLVWPGHDEFTRPIAPEPPAEPGPTGVPESAEGPKPAEGPSSTAVPESAEGAKPAGVPGRTEGPSSTGVPEPAEGPKPAGGTR